jgi:hypothetical protein
MSKTLALTEANQSYLTQSSGRYDAPAFMRRTKHAEDVFQRLLERLRHDRDDLIVIVRLRVGQLKMMAGDWQALHFLLSDEAMELLPRLYDELHPHLLVPVQESRSPTELRSAVDELREAIHYFNLRWFRHIVQCDLTAVNQARDDYNRYFLLEKECVVQSATAAEQDFQPLQRLTHEDLFREFPLLEERLERSRA